MTNIERASDAVERLFDRHADEIYQYVRFTLGDAAEAEDLVQDIFLDALKSWPAFRGHSSERTWLWAIARHRLTDRMRQRSRRSAALIATTDPGITGPEDTAALRLDLEQSLQQLPAPQRQVFIVRIIQDQSTSEAAQLLGWSPVKVRVTLHRALKALKARMTMPESPSKGGDPRERT